MTTNRRLAAILAADVVGYSRLMGQDEAGTLQALKAIRTEIVDPAIARHEGRVFKTTGDGVLVEFASVVGAASCAVEIQRAMDGRALQMRIGVHLGDVIVEGGDVFGDGVNLAARIEGVAPPGGIALSASAYEHVGNRLGLEFEDGGEHSLKNIDRPVKVYRVKLVGASGPVTRSTAQSIASAEKPSLAVLPFNNMSGDQEQEYFADGITEDIITELARNHGLFVIARNSSFVFKGGATNIREVGSKLGVRYVVEGSVRKAGNRVRITAQLIEAATGSHIWAERYDRDLEDIFAVQDEVTRSIASAVPGYVESDIVKASRRKPTGSLGAYDHYLRGMEVTNRWSNDDIPQAMAEFERAVELDPMFARAHAFLGQTYLRMWWQARTPDLLERAKKQSEIAVRIDGEDGKCLGIRAMCLMTDNSFDRASELFERALQLTPDDVELNDMMAYYLLCIGRANEAIERSLKAMRASPLFHPASLRETSGMAFMMARRYEEAIKSFASIGSPYYYIHVYTAACLTKLGRFDEARVQARLANELKPDWPSLDWGYQYTKEEDKENERELVRLAMKAAGD